MNTLKYTTISDNIHQFLDFKDTYRYYCLAITPHKKGYVDSTFKQIKLRTGDLSELTVKDFVARLRKSEYIKIETLVLDDKKRNHYHLHKNESGFRMITNDFLTLDLSMAHKGFLIQLLGLCIGQTLECKLTQKVICQKFGVSDDTIRTYTKELIELGYIIKNGKSLTIKLDCFVQADKFPETVVDKITELYQIDKLKPIIKKTKWANVRNPKAYLLKMEAGLLNSKQEIKINQPIIKL